MRRSLLMLTHRMAAGREEGSRSCQSHEGIAFSASYWLHHHKTSSDEGTERDNPPLHGVSDQKKCGIFNLLLQILSPDINEGRGNQSIPLILRHNNAELSASQWTGPRPTASPKNSLEIQILMSHLRLAEWESLFYIKTKDIFPLMLNFAEPIVKVENQFQGGKQLCLLRR